MNIPNLPTDNLYKFMAIFGLILLLSSAYYVINLTLEASKQQEIIEIEIESLDTFVKDLKVRSDAYLKSNLDEPLWTEKREIIEDQITVLRERQKKLELLRAEFNNGGGNWTRYTISIFFILLGNYLIAVGFKQWYYKHQRYIDAERKWKGETFIELIKDEEAKKKRIREEFEKNEVSSEEEPKKED